ncbi:hypothetical protein ACFWFU_07005 [Streptomyces sp. NPDC060235]|uniref:hypothetical protein n=1 Tax=Streptomyces sp. NPDC060235 TaxID=3347080 RepID=UPI00365D84F2
MHYLIPLGIAAVLFLAMPWLAIAFNRYCDTVNRLMARRAAARHPAGQKPTLAPRRTPANPPPPPPSPPRL